MKGHGAIEVAKTVMEVADMAWTAMECHHHHHHTEAGAAETNAQSVSPEEELESLRSENQRLRNLLEKNLELLRNLSESPCLPDNCPPDLYVRLLATVDSKSFLDRLSHQQASVEGTRVEFPFKEATGADLDAAEILINVNNEEPSWWVWVTDEMVPSKVEEWSGIDDESYVVVSEENVVDGVANFMAKCILSNPKAKKMKPEELQKVLAEALEGTSKIEKVFGIWHAGMMFYTLATWGLTVFGLYKSRAAIKLAAKGVHKTSKLVLKAM